MRPIFMLLVTISLAGLALLPASRVYAANAVVGTGTPGSCSEAAFDTALTAVQGSGGGQITFNCGAAAHTITFSAYKTIQSAVIIDGNDLVTLDGNGSAPFFQVFFNHSLALKHLKLVRGSFSGIHALENFGTLSLENVTMSQHNSSESAVVNYGTLTVRASAFYDNSLVGGNNRAGAAIKNDNGQAQVETSLFSNNNVSGTLGVGGAIAVQGGSMTISGSTFTGNQAFDGGALYIGTGSTVTVTQSTFTGNRAEYGGAIESSGTQLHLTSSNFTANRADAGDGGAIWTLSGDLDVDSSQFINNQAVTTGGAFSCYGDFASVINSSFGGNQAGGNGGAVYSTCDFNLTNVTFSDNHAGSGGGGFYQTGSRPANMLYATLVGNSAIFGAGIYNDGGGTSSLTISKSVLANNVTGNCDGVITSGGYNLANNTSCGAFTALGDKQNASLPFSMYGNFGGPTDTRYPLPGNEAIDIAAQCSFAVDQRGVTRPQNGKCDSGAVEFSRLQLYLPVMRR